MATINTLGIKVTLNKDSKGLNGFNFNNIAIFTGEIAGSIFADGQTKSYYVNSISDVIKDFGEEHEITKAVKIHFMQPRQAETVYLYPWYKTALTVAETKTKLNGGLINKSIDYLKTIKNGLFAITINKETQNILINLSASGITTFENIATKLQEALRSSFSKDGLSTSILVDYESEKNTFTISTGQANATISPAFESSEEGEYIGAYLGLDAPASYIIKGTTAKTIPAESVVASMRRAFDLNPDAYGVAVATPLTDGQVEAVTDYIETLPYKLIALAVNDLSNTARLGTIEKLKAKSLTKTAVVFDKNDQFVNVAYLTQAVANKYHLDRQAGTMKFKTLLGITADNVLDSEVVKCRKLNINAYSDVRGRGVTMDGVNIDGNPTDVLTLTDFIVANTQLKVTNYLIKNNVFLNEEGQTDIKSVISAFMVELNNNGYLSTNTWLRGRVGDLNKGDTVKNGFYIYSRKMSELSSESRDSRTTQPIYLALTYSGYIHNLEISLTYQK